MPDAARAGDCSRRFAIATASLLLRRNAVAAPSADDAPALAKTQEPRRPLARLLLPTRCGYARLSEERHEIAPGLLEKQEADPARSRDWFPRIGVTPAPTRDVPGLAANQSRAAIAPPLRDQGHSLSTPRGLVFDDRGIRSHHPIEVAETGFEVPEPEARGAFGRMIRPYSWRI